MGAWGVGNFDNDDAADWLYGLKGASDLSPLETAIRAVATATSYLEAPECAVALAAAELVAALHGKPLAGLPPEAASYVSRVHAAVPASLRSEARVAVARCRDDSELRELFLESDGTIQRDWLHAVDDLLARLE